MSNPHVTRHITLNAILEIVVAEADAPQDDNKSNAAQVKTVTDGLIKLAYAHGDLFDELFVMKSASDFSALEQAPQLARFYQGLRDWKGKNWRQAKVEGIKLFRTAFNCELREAKNVMDVIYNTHPTSLMAREINQRGKLPNNSSNYEMAQLVITHMPEDLLYRM